MSELNVSLLDQRYLTGDRTLYAGLADRLPRFIHASRDALVRNLAQLTRDRHAKYAGTFYHLEPNVKETPGGLRDFQLVCWLEQMRKPTGRWRGRSVPELQRGLSVPGPPALLSAFPDRPRQQPALLRRAGRDGRAVAAADAAHWMREYYRHAREHLPRGHARALEASEAQSSSLFAQFRDWRSRALQCRFQRAPRARAFPRSAAPGRRARTGCSACSSSWRATASASPPKPSSRSKPACPGCASISPTPPTAVAGAAATFCRCPMRRWPCAPCTRPACSPRSSPSCETIECLVIRDFYHRYTVDEHTLVTMQNLWALAQPPTEHRQRAYATCWPKSKTRSCCLRAAVSRCRQGHAGRRPRGRLGAAARASAMARIQNAAGGSRNGAVS